MFRRSQKVGLDIHKERISIAVAESGRSCAVEYLGEISNDPVAIGKLCDRLERPSRDSLRFATRLARAAMVFTSLSLGHRCDVVAPSLIPTRPGDRVKTNRRDATMLARLHRAGELTPVWVPDADHEAMRDLMSATDIFCCGTGASTGVGQHGEWLIGDGYQLWPSNIQRSRSHFKTMSMPSWMRSGAFSASRSRYRVYFPNGICAQLLMPCRRCGVSL